MTRTSWSFAQQRSQLFSVRSATDATFLAENNCMAAPAQASTASLFHSRGSKANGLFVVPRKMTATPFGLSVGVTWAAGVMMVPQILLSPKLVAVAPDKGSKRRGALEVIMETADAYQISVGMAGEGSQYAGPFVDMKGSRSMVA